MSTRRILLAAAAAATATVTAGCYKPSGGMFHVAGGAVTYYSTERLPTTITLVDTRTEEAIFAVEIPVGRQLTLDFETDEGDDPVNTPDLMRYEIFKRGESFGKLSNAMTVPNRYCRRIDVSYRESPEAAPRPADAPLRADEARPAWWTPEGGPLPSRPPATMDRR